MEGVSTIQEIEAAIERLPAPEREDFESRLISRRFGLEPAGNEEYRELLASLDEAEREIDSGQGVSADALRKGLSEWAGQ